MRITINIFKKLLCIFFAIVLIFVLTISSSVTPAFASENRSKGVITFMKQYCEKNKPAFDKVVASIENMEEYIDLSEFNLPESSAELLLTGAVKTHPYLFYVSENYGYSTAGNKLIALHPIYIASKSEIEAMKAEFSQAVEEILSLVSDKMTQIQKAIIIYDEIAMNCEYIKTGCTAYDALILHKAQCAGYTLAYSYLLSLVGISSEIISSISMGHEWCKICIDGKYYNADLTWDDPVSDKNGHVNHRFFLLSDAAISSPDGEHFGFDDAYYKADSTIFDNSLIHQINTKFCFNGNDFYVINNTPTGEYSKSLLKYNPANEDIKVIKKINTYWISESGNFWNGGYSSLDIYDNVLYYNSDQRVYFYDTLSGYTYVYPADISSDKAHSYFGLVIKNQEIYLAEGTNPNTNFDLVFSGYCEDFHIGTSKTALLKNKTRAKIIIGDPDCDDTPTVMDSTLIQMHIVGLKKLTEAQYIAADCDRNSDVNIIDATNIQRYLAFG